MKNIFLFYIEIKNFNKKVKTMIQVKTIQKKS